MEEASFLKRKLSNNNLSTHRANLPDIFVTYSFACVSLSCGELIFAVSLSTHQQAYPQSFAKENVYCWLFLSNSRGKYVRKQRTHVCVCWYTNTNHSHRRTTEAARAEHAACLSSLRVPQPSATNATCAAHTTIQSRLGRYAVNTLKPFRAVRPSVRSRWIVHRACVSVSCLSASHTAYDFRDCEQYSLSRALHLAHLFALRNIFIYVRLLTIVVVVVSRFRFRCIASGLIVSALCGLPSCVRLAQYSSMIASFGGSHRS